MDTVVCLTLAKWETVSGRFGGYLTPPLSKLSLIRGVIWIWATMRAGFAPERKASV